MLLLDSARSINFDGVTVFPDHADENQFWYLPGPIGLRTDRDGKPKFSLIKYKRAETDDADGGYAMFEVALQLDDDRRRRLVAELRRFSSDPVLSAVQFIGGTVQCIALNLQGGGGTEATPAAGGFAAVRQILGASHPEMFGDIGAAFSLELDPEGATILEAALRGGFAPLGVVYQLDFLGLRPALEVTLRADMNRIYEYFGGSLKAKYLFLEASISAGLEKLREDRVIDLEIKNFSTGADRLAQEKAALDLFKEQLMGDWFTPALTLGAAQGAKKSESSGSETEESGSSESETEESEPSGTGNEGVPAPATPPVTAPQPAPGSSTGTKTLVRPPTATRSAATLEVTTPEAERGGLGLTHRPSSSGSREQLLFTNIDGATVTVDGETVQPTAAGTIDVDVTAGSTKRIVVRRAAAAERVATFRLFFDKDEPTGRNWDDGRLRRRYAEGIPSEPDDDRFRGSAAPGRGISGRGRQALRSWIVSQLAEVGGRRIVRINTHASLEDPPRDSMTAAERVAHDQRLTERRLQVATDLIGDLAHVERQEAHGHTVAETRGNGLNREEDRYAAIEGVLAPARTAGLLEATLTRPATPPAESPEDGEEPTTDPPESTEPSDSNEPSSGEETPPAAGGGGSTPAGGGGEEESPTAPRPPTGGSKASVVFELKFIRQEERRTVTYNYRRSEAVQRVHRPQGFFDLLLDGVDVDDHFMEVDVDDPFFRELALTVQPPADPGPIELLSTNIGIDYGNPADPQNHRFDDRIFDASRRDDWEVSFNFNQSNDTHYAYRVAYRFANGGEWHGSRSVYEFTERDVTKRTLPLTPYEHLAFHPIRFQAEQIDWQAVSRIEVEASVQEGASVLQRRFDLNPSTESHDWKVRLAKSAALLVDLQATTVLLGGRRLETRTLSSDRPQIAITDGLPHALDIAFLVPLGSRHFDSIFIDVVYRDEANGIDRRVERELRQGDQRFDVHLAIVDPDKKSYEVSFTFVDLNAGTRTTRVLTDVEDDVILVTP